MFLGGGDPVNKAFTETSKQTESQGMFVTKLYIVYSSETTSAKSSVVSF
jgi:hypothetical protein